MYDQRERCTRDTFALVNGAGWIQGAGLSACIHSRRLGG